MACKEMELQLLRIVQSHNIPSELIHICINKISQLVFQFWTFIKPTQEQHDGGALVPQGDFGLKPSKE